jgi:hypothetical protein
MTGSGKECIEKYIKEKTMGIKIDLILIDYRLGDMLGDSVARIVSSFIRSGVVRCDEWSGQLGQFLDSQTRQHCQQANMVQAESSAATIIGIIMGTLGIMCVGVGLTRRIKPQTISKLASWNKLGLDSENRRSFASIQPKNQQTIRCLRIHFIRAYMFRRITIVTETAVIPAFWSLFLHQL